MKEVGRIIKSYRKKANLTQPALAKRLEEEAGITITNKAISAWESGYAEPPATTFLYVCKILQIPDVLEAFFGTNPANPMAALNDKGKAKVINYIDELIHPVSYLKEASATYKPEEEKILKTKLSNSQRKPPERRSGKNPFMPGFPPEPETFSILMNSPGSMSMKILRTSLITQLLSMETVWNRISMITTWYMSSIRTIWKTVRSGFSA